MRIKTIPLTLLIMLLVVSSVQSKQEKVVIDDLGFSLTVGPAPQRIISLAPNITEILFALGLGKKVVGVTRYCDYPEEAVRINKIGGMIDPNLEKLISLDPDLIFGFRGNTRPVLKRIRSLGLPLYSIAMGTTIDSIFPVIQKIGRITQKEDEAGRLIKILSDRYTKIRLVLRQVSTRPKVFISLHGTGLWSGGSDSFMHDLVKKAEGVNIAGNIKRRWYPFKREQLILENPDIIIILSKSREDFTQTSDWIKKDPYLEDIEAVKSKRIFFLDENLATRPGPRIIEAFYRVAQILHPKYVKNNEKY